MIQYTCDICGAPMPEDYIRPKQRTGQLVKACHVDDVCAGCMAAGRRLDVIDVLLTAWRALPRAAPAEKRPLGDSPPPREPPVTEPVITGRCSTEKAEILARLRSYRKEHGLGCLADVAKAAGRGITDDTLRGVLHGDVTLDIKGWRQIGKALDRLTAAGEDNGG